MDGGMLWEDLGVNFLLRETGIGQNRAAAAVDQLQELNPMVVTAMPRPTSDVTADLLREGSFNVVLCLARARCPRQSASMLMLARPALPSSSSTCMVLLVLAFLT